MQIADLDYLQAISESHSIVGAVVVGVTSYASAKGNDTYTLASADTKVREFRNGGSIGIGRGKAVAIGNDPIAAVGVYGEGDRVYSTTMSFSSKNKAVARGFIVVIDNPSR